MRECRQSSDGVSQAKWCNIHDNSLLQKHKRTDQTKSIAPRPDRSSRGDARENVAAHDRSQLDMRLYPREDTSSLIIHFRSVNIKNRFTSLRNTCGKRISATCFFRSVDDCVCSPRHFYTVTSQVNNMRYLWCWLFPPFGLITCGKPGQAFLNLLLCCTIIGIPFAILWSFLVARDFYADRRNKELINALGRVRR